MSFSSSLLRSPSVVSFVPSSFRVGRAVPLPEWDSPACRALCQSRAYRTARANGVRYQFAMAYAVLVALKYHRPEFAHIEIEEPVLKSDPNYTGD